MIPSLLADTLSFSFRGLPSASIHPLNVYQSLLKSNSFPKTTYLPLIINSSESSQFSSIISLGQYLIVIVFAHATSTYTALRWTVYVVLISSSGFVPGISSGLASFKNTSNVPQGYTSTLVSSYSPDVLFHVWYTQWSNCFPSGASEATHAITFELSL